MLTSVLVRLVLSPVNAPVMFVHSLSGQNVIIPRGLIYISTPFDSVCACNCGPAVHYLFCRVAKGTRTHTDTTQWYPTETPQLSVPM